MKHCIVILSLVFFLFSTNSNAQFTTTQSGNWDNGGTWGNNAPGVAGVDYPGRGDAAIINSGHIVVVNANNDNGFPGVSPEGLGFPNVGDGVVNGNESFPSAEANMFYHTGDIRINLGGTLRITRRCILGGQTTIIGTLSTTGDVVNLGRLNATSSSTLDIGDDYIMSGNSVTDIDGPILSVDDLYIDHMDAVIGGSGSLGIGDDIQTFNPRNHDPQNQICNQFTVSCGDDCDPSTNGTQASIAGTSGHPICLDLFPVEFKTVEAEILELNKVAVRWTTASETNNDFFHVERLLDEDTWELVAMVYGAGTTVDAQSYAVEDVSAVLGYNYYRVKQVDFDGSFSYSKTVVVEIKAEDNHAGFILAPNPVQANEPIHLVNGDLVEQIEVFNQYGALLKVISNPSTSIDVDLAAGVYNFRIKVGRTAITRRVVVL